MRIFQAITIAAVIGICIPLFVLAKSTKVAKKQSIEKVPRAIFLIKKAKINAGVGEPQYYPAELQLRTVTHDQLLHDFKKFE